MVPVIARGAAAVAPDIINYVASSKPGVMTRVKNWVSRVAGKKIGSVTDWAKSSDNNAALTIEAIVRNGVSVDDLTLGVPNIQQGDMARFLQDLRNLEAQTEREVSEDRQGVIRQGATLENAERIRYAKLLADKLKSVFGVATYSEVWDVITGIESLKQEDLQTLELVYGSR